MGHEQGVTAAVAAWQRVLSGRVVTDAVAVRTAYGANTIGVERQIPAVLRPLTVGEVVEVVTIARSHGIPLYPVSTGHNWGYGSANPVMDGTVVVDLSGMNRILEMDPELGLVTVEPGVTQKQLREYLDAHGHRFLVPVHGGGPECSLIGNALERGYGITPYADHFGAVTCLEAVLTDGEIYRSALSEMGGVTVDRAFKWGIGPYIDGLFTQGNAGIVTQMTIALAPVPVRVYNFFFWIEKDESLEEAVFLIRDTLRSVGMNCGSINLMNQLRVLSMMEQYPAADASGGLIPPDVVAAMARRNMVLDWTVTGAIYGNEEALADATKAIIRKKLGPLSKRMIFLSERSLCSMKKIAPLVPGEWGGRLDKLATTLDATYRLISGSPSEIALPLSYWISGTKPAGGKGMDPARDGCGLIWYSPLVPMKPERVRVFVEMVKRVCIDHRVNPLITLTSISDRCFDSTIPLLFDRKSREEAERTQACYDALFVAGQQEGFIPYRIGVQSMHLLPTHAGRYMALADRIKSALDPDNIMAPGRYSSYQRGGRSNGEQPESL